MVNEKELNEIKKKNREYVKGFQDSLKEEGLSKKTIDSHISYVELFIFDYLCNYDYIDPRAEEGLDEVFGFLNGWFLEKCMWASKNSINTALAALKKFYKYMSINNYVDPNEYKSTFSFISDNKDEIYESLQEIEDGTYWDKFM